MYPDFGPRECMDLSMEVRRREMKMRNPKSAQKIPKIN